MRARNILIFAVLAALFVPAQTATAQEEGLLALAGLISMARVSQRFRWLQLLTLLSALATALVIIGLIVVDPAYPGVSDWANVLGLCALLTVGGSIIVPVAHVMNRVETAERVETLDVGPPAQRRSE